MSPGFSVSVCMSDSPPPPPPGAGGSSDQWPALGQSFGPLSPASWGQVSFAAAQHAVQIQQDASAEQMSQLLALMRDIAHDATTAAVRAVLQAHDLPRLSLQHQTAQPEPAPPPPAAPVQPEPMPLPPAAPVQPEPVPPPPAALRSRSPCLRRRRRPRSRSPYLPPPPQRPPLSGTPPSAQPEPVPLPPSAPVQPEPVPPPPAAPAQPELVPPPPAAPAHPEPASAATTSALGAIQHPAIPSVAAISPGPAPPTRPRSPERTMNRIGAGFLGSINFVTMCTGLDLAFAISVLRRGLRPCPAPGL
eukprot:jgi/Tetstr1/439303/TSEL_027744.t1